MKYIICFCIALGLMNCKTSSKIAEYKPRIKPNIYTTQKLNIIQARKYSYRYGTRHYGLIIMALDLKADSTYIISFCQRNIAQSGKWYVKKDSIHLFSIKSYMIGKDLPDVAFFVSKKGYIFYNNGSPTGGHKMYSTVLKINGNLFDGKYDTVKQERNEKVIEWLKSEGRY